MGCELIETLIDFGKGWKELHSITYDSTMFGDLYRTELTRYGTHRLGFVELPHLAEDLEQKLVEG